MEEGEQTDHTSSEDFVEVVRYKCLYNWKSKDFIKGQA